MSGKDSTYKYSESFQKRILALCLNDISFIHDYGEVIKPSYFDYSYLVTISKVIIELITKHGQLPSKSLLVEEIKDRCESHGIGDEDRQYVLEELDEIYSIKIIDSEALKARVIRFGKRQALKAAVIEVADIVDNDAEYDKVNHIITNALLVGENVNDLGAQVFGNFYNIPSEIRVGELQYGTKISTGFPLLDSAIRGGTKTGEVWVIMGPPGSGKSQVLVNIGAVAILHNWPVAHITIGDLDEEDVKVRYGARLTHTTMDDVIDGTEDYLYKAKKLDKMIGRYLRVKYYAPNKANPETLRSYLSKLISIDGVVPKVIIVDYPEEFKPYMPNDTYQNMGRIYSDLKTIAYDYKSVVWTASQVRRWRADKDTDVITQDNISDSWLKAAKADGILSFNQTVTEYHNNRGRLWIDKTRKGKKFFLVPVMADMAGCYIRQLTKEEMEKEDDDE